MEEMKTTPRVIVKSSEEAGVPVWVEIAGRRYQEKHPLPPATHTEAKLMD